MNRQAHLEKVGQVNHIQLQNFDTERILSLTYTLDSLRAWIESRENSGVMPDDNVRAIENAREVADQTVDAIGGLVKLATVIRWEGP